MRVEMRSCRPPRHGGFTLIELLVVLLLLAAFSVIYTDGVTLAVRAGRDARARDELVNRVDNAMDTLRRDVWSATGIRVSGTQVELEEPGGVIVWKTGDDGTLTRMPPAADALPTTWTGLSGLSFTSSGALLTLHVTGANGEEEATFVSQRMLAGAKP